MKQKLLKSLLAVALLLAGGNVWADEVVLYSQDFDSEASVPTGWTQANGTLSLEVSGGNKWLRETTAGSGSRTAWYTGTAIKDAIGAYTSYTLEFDCLIKEGTNTTNYAQGVWVTGSNLAQSWGTPTGYAIGVMKGSNETTYTIQANAAATEEKVNLVTNTWYHYVCAYDHSTKKITFSILSQDKSSTIYAAHEFDYDYSADGKGVFQSIHFQAGRGSGYTELDNIKLTTEVDEEFVGAPSISSAYAGANRTVTIVGGTSTSGNDVTTYYTLDGTDPTSLSLVYSEPLDISSDCTVKAISISTTDASSAVTSLDVTVGKLTLVSPSISKTDYSAGNYTVTMSSDQSGLAYVPASPVIKYSIDGGAAQTYSSAVQVPEGSTVTAHVEAENYTNSTNAVLATGVMPLFAEVWSTDFTALSEAEVEYTETTFGSTFYVLTNVNGNFGVAAVAGSNRFYIHNGGLYVYYSGNRQFAINNLEEGDYIRITSSIATTAVSNVTLQNDLSYGNVYIYKATADGVGIFSTPRYNVIYKVEVLKETTEVDLAILDCKQYETSAAFATAVAGESFANAAEVYAFHTAWQIAQADAASSNDITKVIRNAAVADGTDWNDARRNSGQQYTGAPDNTYFDAWDQYASNASQTIYGLPAGTYTLKVATRASETLTDINKYNVWVNGGTADARVLGHHEGSEGNFLGNGWNWTVITFTLDAAADVNIGFYSLPGKSSNLWAGCDDWHLYKGTLTHPVSISELGWATLYTPYALNFDGTGLTAYTASIAGSTVTLTPVTEVPANTGVVLNGAEGNYDIPVIMSSETAKGSLMGNAAAATSYDAAGSGNAYYVLAPSEDANYQVQFRPVTSGSIAAGKAFLEAPYDAGGGVKAFDIDIAGADAIDDVRSKMEEGRSEIFNLAGQRMNRLQKGVNIVNGKKILVK